MVEIELSILSAQCQGGRLLDKDTLLKKVAAWQRERNGKQEDVDRQFTAADVRIKLKYLYLRAGVQRIPSSIGSRNELPAVGRPHGNIPRSQVSGGFLHALWERRGGFAFLLEPW